MDQRVKLATSNHKSPSTIDGGSSGFESILFGPGQLQRPPSPGEPDYFHDLNLDQIVSETLAGREEYELTPFFYEPLRNLDALSWRHEVFHDLASKPIADALLAFAEAMRKVRESQAQSAKYYYQHQKNAELVNAAETYAGAVTRLAKDLAAASPSSRGLSGFARWLAAYVAGGRFTSLLEQARKVRQALAEVRYSLLISGGSVRVTRYHESKDYSAVVAATFEKFRQRDSVGANWKMNNWLEMNHVEAGILDRVAQLFPSPFGQLSSFAKGWAHFADDVILRFDREIQFYLAWVDYLAPLQEARLAVCTPTLSIKAKTERVKATYDIALAHKLLAAEGKTVTNDYHLDGAERIIVVTGPNQGGKTTFARMFGQLHHLAALGCPVPGSAARLFVFDRLFAHFEREESVVTQRGKLEDEVFRIHNILDAATTNSIIVINEIFASTSLSDAVDLATRVMKQIIERGTVCVCVTFLDEIAVLGPSVVSCSSTVVQKNPAERTFKIIRKPPDGNAFAIFLARRHGLTAGQITKRIAP